MPNLPDDHDPFADAPLGDETPLGDEAAREIETRMNIHRLKNEAKEITGSEMRGFESPDAPPEVLEQFWKNIVAFERAESFDAPKTRKNRDFTPARRRIR